MAGSRNTTLRNMTVTIGDTRGLPFVYPIFPSFTPGESRALCAEFPTILHTSGRRKASMRLISLINLRIEPRASLHPTVVSSPAWSAVAE